MVKLIHITSAANAINILNQREYATWNNPGNYDAGMNFLGSLGEGPNTKPTRGAEIHCEWSGLVSQPLGYGAFGCSVPNMLYDFNGSGSHFVNKDPRYFLPYGSEGLVIKAIKLEVEFDKLELIETWCENEGGHYRKLYEYKFLHKYLLKKALNYLEKTNERIASERFTISIRNTFTTGRSAALHSTQN